MGADRIARTAHAALRLLGEVRQAAKIDLPLAWSPSFGGIAAIEVYPAATLVAHGIRASVYKAADQRGAREEIVNEFRREITLGRHNPTLVSNADVLDAAVCILAAKDFLNNQVYQPENRQLAEREGWIWARCNHERTKSNAASYACPVRE